MDDLYQALGVPKDATDQELKQAYRAQAKVHHPDKGGDKDKFQLLQLAYSTLTDPNRRARYDSTREAQPQVFLAVVQAVIEGAMSQDPLRYAKQKAQERIDNNTKTAKRCASAAVKLRKVAKRIKRTADGPNLLSQAVDNQADIQDQQAAKCEEDSAFFLKVITFIEGYQLEPDPEAMLAMLEQGMPLRWR